MENSLTNSQQRVTAASLLVALGIIYGDIGTSPLYVLKAVIGDRKITEELVLGGISCIFWTLVIQTTVKYIWLTLKADNEGEGGIFSLYALVRKYGRWLAIPTILGATTLLADGIITPPISVASAVEGLTGVSGLEHLKTVPIIIVVLSLLFIIQRFGTHRVGGIFGPAMLLWFLMLLVLGFYGISMMPTVFRALNPVYAWDLLTAYPAGFWLLGAVFLATTGAEALYSDLGHCGRKNIRITWVFVKICLVINYLGQGAWALTVAGGELNGRNPIFELMPSWFLLTGIIVATIAAIIASQALISGSYTLISEAMNLNFWPRVEAKQTSGLKGQVYIPSVNNLLWFGCILMILYFRTSAHMEAAYGFSITVTMMMTTLLLTYYLLFRLKWKGWLVAGLVLLFTVVEGSFFISNAAKIRERWMFLFFELFIFLVMYTWYYARKLNNRYTHFTDIGKYAALIRTLSEDTAVPKYATHLVYLTKANNRHEVEEKIVRSILARKPKRADVYWLFHVHRTDQPSTLEYEVTELLEDKLIKINMHIGFRLQPKVEWYFKQIVQELSENRELNLHNRPDGSTIYNSGPDFKFIVIRKFLSVETDFSFRDWWLLKGYFFLRSLGQSDEQAFGLDRSDVVTEEVPFVHEPACHPAIKRVAAR